MSFYDVYSSSNKDIHYVIIQLYMKQQKFPIKTLHRVEQKCRVYPPTSCYFATPAIDLKEKGMEKKLQTVQCQRWRAAVDSEPLTESEAALLGQLVFWRCDSDPKNAAHPMKRDSCLQAQRVAGHEAFVWRYNLMLLKAATFLSVSCGFGSKVEAEYTNARGKYSKKK